MNQVKSIDQNSLLFIKGPPKTGTSSLLGMLNCHPDIFILYEVYLAEARISKNGDQLLSKFPEARRFFYNSSHVEVPYIDFFNWLINNYQSNNYQFVGDKIVGLGNYNEKLNKYKTLVTFRDLPTWLCKHRIIYWYRTDLDVVRPAIDYVNDLLYSHLNKDWCLIKMEDFIMNYYNVLQKIAKYIDISLDDYCFEYWKKIDKLEEENLKSAIQWAYSHRSSKAEPKNFDVKYELKMNSFWERILPIFYKYYEAKIGDFKEKEVFEDLNKLKEIQQFSFSLEECFEEINSYKINKRTEKFPQKVKNYLKRLARLK